MKPPCAEQALFRFFYFCNGKTTIHPIGLELHLVADLHCFQLGRIGDNEDHRHAIHVQIFDRAVLEGDLALSLIDLGDLPIGGDRLCQGGGRDSGR